MEAERTRVNVARERAVVVHQEAQTEHRRAVMMVLRLSMLPRMCSCPSLSNAGEIGLCLHSVQACKILSSC